MPTLYTAFGPKQFKWRAEQAWGNKGEQVLVSSLHVSVGPALQLLIQTEFKARLRGSITLFVPK